MIQKLLTYLILINFLFAQELCFQKFTVENGLPQSSVLTLYQDNNGFIWIGTQDGIARYDGHEFEYFKTKDGLPEGNVYDIFQTSDGIYYFATSKGIAKFDGIKVKNISKEFGLENVDVRKIVEDKDKNLWIATVGKGVLKVSTDNKITYFNTDNNFFSNIVRKIFIDTKNRIWFLSGSAGNGVCYLDNNKFYILNKKQGLLADEIFSIYEDDNGNIYLGSSKGVSIIKNILQIENITLNYPILSITKDNYNKIFCASWGSGLFVIDKNKKIINYTIKNGLLSNNIWTILKSRRGDIWFGSENGGLQRFPAEQMYFYSTSSGLKSNATFSFCKLNNIIYFTSYSGLGIIQNNKISYLTTANGLTSNELYSLYEYNNKIYIGSENNINLINNNQISQLNIEKLINIPVYHNLIHNNILYSSTPNGLFTFYINKGLEFKEHLLKDYEIYYSLDIDDKIYFCTNNGLFILNTQTNQIKHYTTDNGLPSNTLTMATKTQDNNIFLSTPNGLSYFDGNKFINYTTDDGLSNNFCYSVLFYKNKLFVGTNNGLNICYLKNNKIIRYKYLTQKDGLPSNEFNQGALYITDDSLLLAGTVNGLLIYNLNHRPIDLQPTILMKELKVNDKSISNTDYVELPYKRGKLEINFSSIFYGSKVKYYYKIDGLNDNWTVTENPYLNLQALPFGNYKLYIKAKNSDGFTTDEILLLSIFVHPPFYLQAWFIISSIAMVFVMAYGVSHYKTYQIKKRNILLEKLVQERTYQLQLEKEKSENLLLNILPESIVSELKTKGYAEPREYKSVSIMFTDFKGFTQIASGLTPAQLVDELNDIFKHFDEIIDKYEVEKIKTIGDSYMVCAGVPVEREDHAEILVKCAIDMQKFLKQRATQKNINWQMRVGIHSGSIMAGVVGLKKFTFDIWGDTVNIASRMESSGVPGEINISEATYDLVKDKFECIYRGKVEAKGKGLMDMYLIKQY